MSLVQFDREVLGDRLGENDQVWFPRWLRRYAMTVRCGLVDDLSVNKGSVLDFSRALLADGASAWQRYQTVQKLMGHKDVETTMRYVHVGQELGRTIKSRADTLIRDSGSLS